MTVSDVPDVTAPDVADVTAVTEVTVADVTAVTDVTDGRGRYRFERSLSLPQFRSPHYIFLTHLRCNLSCRDMWNHFGEPSQATSKSKTCSIGWPRLCPFHGWAG